MNMPLCQSLAFSFIELSLKTYILGFLNSKTEKLRNPNFSPGSLFIYLFIYDELVQQFTEKYKKKKIKQMNIEYNYDTHKDSIIKSMSAAYMRSN